ncbi:PC-Esterase [Arabidopsis suecica]|uniref:PC-Esterase n=1 Tax=Arabidopsis suecica TaxID=45249 RepID=A0A8T1XD53_ARASU|nr:PC-Esterase [Arabidopsis suecica]
MASDSVNHLPIHGVSVFSSVTVEIKNFFSAVKPRKTSTFVYAFVVTIVAFTVFLAFSPSPITVALAPSISSYTLPNVTVSNSPALQLPDQSCKGNISCPDNKKTDVYCSRFGLTYRVLTTRRLMLNGGKLLEMIVGDSLNKNMWESLVCILKGSVKDESQVFEAHGRHQFRWEAEYSFVFKDYNCTVEFFASPFLVQEWEVTEKNRTKETLRLDLVRKSSEQYRGADILVYNTGHWWTHEKTSKGEDYYKEGSNVHPKLDVDEAFRKALTTWGRWVDKNRRAMECDDETEPIKNETYLTPYMLKMEILETVLRGMKTLVTYLNITRLTDYRKDAHPSIYRKQKLSAEESKSPLLYQDCSHWCLPGVPDSWNEILYAEILVKLDQLGGS